MGYVTLSVPVDITFDNRFTNGLLNDIFVLNMIDSSTENQIAFSGVATAGKIPMRMDIKQDGTISSFECNT